MEGEFTHSSILQSIYALKVLSPASRTGLLLSLKPCYCLQFNHLGNNKKAELFACVHGVINTIQRPKAKMI